jgi:energy-coupling factor transporter transmembrane protein EcfT
LHRLDPRFKLASLLLLSIASLNAGFWSLLAAGIGVLAVHASTGVRLRAIAAELKIFLFFLLFIFLARSLSTPGDPLFELYGIGPTRQGILLGLQVCWRLGLIVMASLALVVTTRSMEIKGAVEFFFARVPLVPGKRVSTMLSLMVRFIPLILGQVQDTLDAQKSRCVEMRRNPVTRLYRLTVPVMRRIFRSGDLLSIAMASRCYSDERTPVLLRAASRDWIFLACVCLLALMMQIV